MNITVTTGQIDLTGHDSNCELRHMPMTMCSATAMALNRKVYSCTCGNWSAVTIIRIRWYHRLFEWLKHKIGRCEAWCSHCYDEACREPEREI